MITTFVISPLTQLWLHTYVVIQVPHLEISDKLRFLLLVLVC